MAFYLVSSAPKGNSAPKGPPKLALEGNKWVVENYNGNNDIVIDQTEIKHTVYIYNCQNSTVKVMGKVNAISLGNFPFILRQLQKGWTIG